MEARAGVVARIEWGVQYDRGGIIYMHGGGWRHEQECMLEQGAGLRGVILFYSFPFLPSSTSLSLHSKGSTEVGLVFTYLPYILHIYILYRVYRVNKLKPNQPQYHPYPFGDDRMK
jgi:hypothetical protein